MMDAHGGNVRALAERAGRPCGEIIDFSASISPLGPPACLRPVLSRNLDALVRYPDPQARRLVAALAGRYGLPEDQIVVGNGSSEILHALPLALKPSAAVVPVPSYTDYVTVVRRTAIEIRTITLREEDGFALHLGDLAQRLKGHELVLLGQPNNPTGRLFDVAEFRRLASRHADTVFMVDEAFADFVEDYDTLARSAPDNVVVLRSLTKFYAIPGLRLGFAVAAASVARRIRQFLTPWSVNTLAQAAGAAMLADDEYIHRNRAFVRRQRLSLAAGLARLPGLHVYPGTANFLLVRLIRSDMDAPALAERLLQKAGIAIRTCENFPGLDRRFFRLAVRTREENECLLAALAETLGMAQARAKPRRTPALMFQGTSSNAGKSILTTALCRILRQDGLRVAPFKAQNMSLNSYVTVGGEEMGRAQVVQAQACRLEPEVRMNPILLKPNSDTGCQVLVRGRPVGNMNAREYVDYKPRAFAAAQECYDSLAMEFDAVVLEGAGSPGEVNLKSHDIVNMPMARHAGAPVLIVGDIDRGGVFASFVGTMEVLARWERRWVAGWVVNRFRGDVSLLGDALEYTLAHTGRPVFGVVPYLSALGIPQEDSVEFKSGVIDDRKEDPCVELALIDLPHLSNGTDFDALSAEPDVRMRVVRGPRDLGRPDALILPGSKNVRADLEYLRRSGLARRILEIAAADQAQIIGICGGFQMLGRRILDGYGIESTRGGSRGLALLAVETVLAPEKTLARVRARHTGSDLEVHGYEIHHGRTRIDSGSADLQPVLVRQDGQAVGLGRPDGRVWGTYLHGIFDADEFRRWFVDRLRVHRGRAPLGRVVTRYDIEPALDRLADVVRQSLNLKEIYRVMGL